MALARKDREELLKTLKVRFEKNMHRHKGLEWTQVQARLEADAGKSQRSPESLLRP